MIEIVEIEPGEGAVVKDGDTIAMHYRGTLLEGKEFDSSYKRNQPFSFRVGSGQVIRGFDMGVLGMKPGGKRKITIPPDFGYGARGAGSDIPPNSTLVFEIEIVSIA
jgi:FKBP-type peptidyl-prolyl cis-trans isomerase